MEWNNEYLSVGHSKCMKGIFACLVLLCHIRSEVPELNNTIIGMLLTSFGYLSVGMFFFLSGYGLEIKKRNDSKYMDNFVINRIVPFYCICIIAILIYIPVNVYFNGIHSINIKLILQSFLFGRTIVRNGWYLQAIICMYFIFYLMHMHKNKKNQMSILAGELFVYICCCYLFSENATIYYESILAFPLGIVWADQKERLDSLIKSYYTALVPEIFIIFSVTVLLGNGLFGLRIEFVQIIIKMLSSVFFVILTLVIVRRFSVQNKLTLWLGDIYAEIYILQGVFLTMWHRGPFYINNPILYAAFVSVSTVACATICHPWLSHMVQMIRDKLIASKIKISKAI